MIILITGGTGTGKDFIVEKLKDKIKAQQIQRPTTRPQRDIYDMNYDFLTVNTYSQLDLFHSKIFNDWSYGFYNSILDQAKNERIFICSCDVRSAQEVGKKVVENGGSCILVHVRADKETRYQRCIGRQAKPDYQEIRRRMKADDKDNKDVDLSHFIDFDNSRKNSFFFRVSLNKLVKEIMEDEQWQIQV